MFLNALPGLGGNRSEAHKYLNGLVGAVEMLRKGCTTCCDLFFEYPKPGRAGLHAVAHAYADIGVRAVVAPMVADRTFYQAFPELLAAMPEPLRQEALQLQMAPPEASADAVIEAIADWPFDSGRIRPGLAPTIPLHCSDNFLLRCRDIAADYKIPVHMHLAASKV